MNTPHTPTAEPEQKKNASPKGSWKWLWFLVVVAGYVAACIPGPFLRGLQWALGGLGVASALLFVWLAPVDEKRSQRVIPSIAFGISVVAGWIAVVLAIGMMWAKR